MPTTRFFLLCAAVVLGGCASTHNNPKDPFESYNRTMYQINDTVDKAVVKPVAKGYNAVVPEPGRMIVSNFFSNLDDVVVTANDLLELQVKRAASDTGRFVVNTTVGLLGVADVATAVGLEKHHKDFGQTLGYWGIGSGPYVVLPLLGPSSVRDTVGLYADTRVNQLRKIRHVDTRNEALVTDFVDKRADLLSAEKILDEAAPDRYAFIRDAYLQRRQSLIDEDNPQPRKKKYEDEEEEDAKPAGKGATNDSAVQSAQVAPPTVALPATARDTGAMAAPQHPPVIHIWTSQAGAR